MRSAYKESGHHESGASIHLRGTLSSRTLMGAFCCCCFSSEGSDNGNSPAYRYGQRAAEERLPLSHNIGITPTFSTGLLVDTNLETSTIETYRTLPRPTPFDANPGNLQSPPSSQEIIGNKNSSEAQTRELESVGSSTHSSSGSIKNTDDLKKGQVDVESALTEKLEIELSKPLKSISFVIEEEDVCPTCLEEYDDENPKILTKCDHHFHLACILEWKERSETCPVCDQEMIICSPINL